jgi:succinate-semialdehyde dehydrogenase/glutarate-semialdehyde dehydrogenase
MTTPIDHIPAIIEKSRSAQQFWSALGISERCAIIKNAREHILDHIDEIAALISEENGKPLNEAIIHDILPVLELMTYFSGRATRLLKKKNIPMRLMLHRKSHIEYWPMGVIAVISPWNFPFSIPFGEIVLALLAGNSVILKPSEYTERTGLKIQEIMEHSGLPSNVLTVVTGGPEHGHALVTGQVNKIFFTGSVATGKKVMAAASNSLTPVILELGGKDAMIVMPDADIDYATSAALWGAFANSGQVCASIERIIVHETIHDRFVEMLTNKINMLSRSETSKNLGRITMPKQLEVYNEHIEEARRTKGIKIHGGQIFKDQQRMDPTIVYAESGEDNETALESLRVYREETFGPIVAVTKYRTIQQAIDKTNDSQYGLLASIIGKDLAVAQQMASRLQVGSVLINEVIYTHGLPETPWGGVKNTGFGVVHSDDGLLEFVHKRHVHSERIPGFRIKSPWWFPYSEKQLSAFKNMLECLYRRSLVRRALALPNFLFEMIELIKKDKRL